MRAKMSVLRQALTGHFTEHHAFPLGMMLDRTDALTARIEEAIAPYTHQVAQLDEIPASESPPPRRSSPRPAPTCPASHLGHLMSWAKSAPKARQSLSPSKAAATGNPWLGGTIGEAAAAATRTSTFLGARHKRIVRRRGRNAP